MQVEESELTTIRVTKGLRNALKELGKKGETYEEILWRLIKNAKCLS